MKLRETHRKHNSWELCVDSSARFINRQNSAFITILEPFALIPCCLSLPRAASPQSFPRSRPSPYPPLVATCPLAAPAHHIAFIFIFSRTALSLQDIIPGHPSCPTKQTRTTRKRAAYCTNQTYFDLEGATNVKLSNAKQHTQPSRKERGM
jgi:hypothetical protein